MSVERYKRHLVQTEVRARARTSEAVLPKRPIVASQVTTAPSAPVQKTIATQPQNNYKKPLRIQNMPQRRQIATEQQAKRPSLPLVAVAQSAGGVVATPLTYFVPVLREPARRWWKTAMNIVGIAVFIFAAGVSVQTFLHNKQAKEQVAVLSEQTKTDAQGVVEGTGNDPSEAPIDETAFWSYRPINPEHPRYLRIPQLSVYARIKSVGVTSEGAVDAPANIYDVGWYNGGAIPGNKTGTSLLLGHVSGWTEDGVFKKLVQLQEGAQFEVEKGSGEVITYEVYKKESYSVDTIDMQKILNADVPGQHDLKLMTCSGAYDASRETYLDRLVVYARPVR